MNHITFFMNSPFSATLKLMSIFIYLSFLPIRLEKLLIVLHSYQKATKTLGHPIFQNGNLWNKNSLYNKSCVSTSKTTAKRTVVESKIATRGSFFDQASFNLFMEKLQQKQSPKNTA